MSNQTVEMMAKARRELVRWGLLQSLHVAAPEGCTVPLLRTVIVGVYSDATEHEVEKELDYLKERGLIHLSKPEMQPAYAKLTRDGTDVVEYTVSCEAGIARPRK
jgi:hypothetical protein